MGTICSLIDVWSMLNFKHGLSECYNTLHSFAFLENPRVRCAE